MLAGLGLVGGFDGSSNRRHAWTAITHRYWDDLEAFTPASPTTANGTYEWLTSIADDAKYALLVGSCTASDVSAGR